MNYLKKIFSGDPSASFGRLMAFLGFGCMLIWTTALIVKNPVAIPDIPANWLMIIMIPYGITKAGEFTKKD